VLRETTAPQGQLDPRDQLDPLVQKVPTVL